MPYKIKFSGVAVFDAYNETEAKNLFAEAIEPFEDTIIYKYNGRIDDITRSVEKIYDNDEGDEDDNRK